MRTEVPPVQLSDYDWKHNAISQVVFHFYLNIFFHHSIETEEYYTNLKLKQKVIMFCQHWAFIHAFVPGLHSCGSYV